MRNFLNRIWSAFVGAVAGASVGLVVAIVLVQSQVELDRALGAVWNLALVGGVVAAIVGNKSR